MKRYNLLHYNNVSLRMLHKTLTIIVLVALLAGLIPPPLLRTLLPSPAAELVEAVLPSPSVAQAAPFGPYSNTTSGTITNNACLGTPLYRTIDVPTNFVVQDLNVGINLSHVSRGEVNVTLTSPSGTTVQIIAPSSDTFDNYDVLLDSASANPLNDGSNDTVASPVDRTASPSNSLNAFNGQLAQGTWNFMFCDTSTATNPSGSFNRAELTFDGTTIGTIKVVKRTVGSNGTFTFSSNDTTFNNLNLSTYSNVGSTSVIPKAIGTYTITENALTGATLTNIQISGDSGATASTTDVANRRAVLRLDVNESLIVTYTNTYVAPTGTIQIVKQTVGGNGSFGYTSSNTTLDGIHLTTVGGTASSAVHTLNAGNYTISEDLVSGWSLTALSCTGDTGHVATLANRQVTINLDAGENVVCTFNNTAQSSSLSGGNLLTITKSLVGTGSGSFTVNVVGSSGYVTSTTVTAGVPKVLSLPNGVYTVTESSPGAGWTTSYSVISGNGTASASNAVVTLSNNTPNAGANPAFATTGTLSGNVFRDFNASGARDAGLEPGQVGVNVLVQCVSNAGADGVVGTRDDVFSSNFTTTTGADGNYSLSSLPRSLCRVSFTLPSGLSFLAPGKAGGTSTQFVNLSGGTGTANVGVNDPSDYSTANSTPDLATQVWWTQYGDPSQPMAATRALYRMPYGISGYTQGTAQGRPGEVGGPDTVLTTFEKLGATWGLAYQRSTGMLFLATVVRRGMSLPYGPDAIIKVNASTGALLPFVTTVDTDGGVMPADSSRNVRDTTVYGQVGTLGWGDLDILADDQTLVGVNLRTKTLEFINATSGLSVGSVTIPTPSCTNGVFRPWALAVQDGLVYTGGVCDAITGTTANLTAHIYAYNPGSVALRLPGNTGSTTLAPASWSSDLLAATPLNYSKGCVGTGGKFTVGGVPIGCGWRTWVSNPATWATDVTFSDHANGGVTRPTPLLADIEFDNDGSLIVGFLDRSALQNTAWRLDGAGARDGFLNITSGGDVLRFSPPASTGGTFVREAAGTVARGASLGGGTLTGFGTTGGVNTSGSGEFYDDNFVEDLTPTYGHPETSLGALALVPGRSDIVLAAFDPRNATDNNYYPYLYSAQGLRWLGNSNGAYSKGFVLQDYCDAYFTANTTSCLDYNGTGLPSQAGFAKSIGMGDVEALSSAAPIEIGNRVWSDVNGNGVQDPGEPGLSGITVSLQGPTTTVTTNTDANGLYYFTNLRTYTAYTLTLNTPAGYSLTQANASALSGAGVQSNHPFSDTIDSDATLVSNRPTIYYSTGGVGQNNHGLDFGFTQPATGQVGITNIAPPGAIQVNKVVATTDGSSHSVMGNFTINVTCGGVTVSPSSQAVTAGGSVTFSNIPAGSSCNVSESTNNLPAPPSGYVWVAHQVTSVPVTVITSQTTAVTVRNTLSPQTSASHVLTVTKTISGSGSGPFSVIISGPNGYNNSTTINPGTPVVLSGLASGVYTVTETSPGAGWTTTYTATASSGSASGGSSNAVVTLQNASTVTPVTAAAISGQVYRDFNSDGLVTASVDVGVSGVLVSFYGPGGNACGSTTTNATGNYNFTPTCTGPWRVEFTTLPSGYEPTTRGAANGTSTQFVSTSGASNINLGIAPPCDYCQVNPPALTPLLIVGSYTGAFANNTAAIRYAYNSTGQVASTPGVNLATAARHSQIGSTYGVAAHQESDTYYVAAFYRRGAGFGPQGTGAIYSISAANAVAHYATIPNAGAGTHDFSRNPITDIWYDAPGVVGNPSTGVVSQPGKVALGDIEISNDGTQMYVVNLNDRQLYRLPATSSIVPVPVTNIVAVGDLTTVNLSGTGYNCAAAERRPFALAFDAAGKLYVGMVCSGETRAPTSLPYANASDYPWAYILRFDDPGFTPVFDFSINFERHSNLYHARWTDNIIQNNFGGDTGNVTIPGTGSTVLSNQPLLTDIVFERGDMVLSLRARGIDQTWANGAHTSSSILVRACTPNGVTWALESAGVCGGVTGTDTSVGYGPNNGLFYDVNNNADSEGRVTGGLAVYPGGDLLVAYSDPFDTQSGGMARFRNRTEGGNPAGSFRQAYELMDNGSGSGIAGASGYMGKGSGIGDIELLCDPAPLEIGNRVWNDLDGDGVQDAGEPGISGITVSRQGPTNTVTTVTDASGLYYFGNLRSATAYTLTMSVPTGYGLTAANTQALSGASVSSNHAISDTRDSDAALVGGLATIYYTTGFAGQNNHGLDFGLTPQASGRVGITNVPPTPIDLRLVKSASVVTATIGIPFTYMLTVTNQSGVNTATNVTLNDPLPVGLTFTSATPSGGTGGVCSYNSGTRTVTCTWATLPPGQQATVIITVTP